MVEVASPKGNPYCIDSREVTQGEFFEFLDQFLESPTVSSQPKADAGKWPEPTGCEWNTSLLPPYLAEPCYSLAPLAFSRKNEHPDYPVACVNWCSAASYCLWAGKRLCGRIGGGSLKAAEVADPSLGEWNNACIQGGTTSYGYGDSVKSDLPSPGNLYNGKDPLPADSASQCRGTNPPFDKIQGIGCNVAEWQDDCETGSYATACAVQAFAVSGEPEGRCDSRFAALQRDNDIRIGFRCCHD